MKVPDNPLDSCHMRFMWIINVEAYLLDRIGDVRLGEGEVLEGVSKALIGRAWYK